MLSRQSDSDIYWEPGQNLPGGSSTSLGVSNCTDSDIESNSLVDVLQTLQSSVDGQFTQINSTLGQISTRLDALEGRQQSIEEPSRMANHPPHLPAQSPEAERGSIESPLLYRCDTPSMLFNCMSI